MSKREEKGVVSENAPLAEAKEGETESPEGAAAEAADVTPSSDREKIAALEREVAELKDQVLRRAAEFENFRKRMVRERDDGVAYANQMLLLDIVPVIDDFERAMESAESSKDFDAFHDGIVLIERRLTSLLEKKWGLVRFGSHGEPFDPNRHQAISMEESATVGAPTVVDEYQKGYLLRDRVLRPAQVKVAQPAAQKQAEQDSESSKET